jgi:formamidopyrimidine-DNA glycosylase
MPELPEVETIRRQLAPHLEGRQLERLAVLDERWSDPVSPAEVADAVEGRRILHLARRGKYFDVELEGEMHVVMHLRMTGNLLLVPAGDDEARPYTRVRFELDDGSRVLFTDPRRFGTGHVLAGDDARDEYFAERLGIEPLSDEFTPESLRELTRNRRALVKAFLLSQDRIAGVGNIYADEALWAAKIHPLREVGRLKGPQIAALHDAVVGALQAGIEAKGATIDDFRNADGARGSYQDGFQAYGREGEPCRRCGSAIRKIRAAGRGTYFCPRCQPRPRAVRR